MTKAGYTKIVNIMTLEAGILVLRCGHISHKMKKKTLFFSKSSSLLRGKDKKPKYIVIMSKEGSFKIVNYDLWDSGSCARVWPYTL